jgi:predicted dehydrogenase
MKPLKVGLVGVSRGSGTVAPFALYPETKISVLCDLNPKRLGEVARDYEVPDNRLFGDYDQFLDSDIDIVVVGTPIQLHAEQTLAALQAGKHVMSEVTMAYRLEDCQKIIDAVHKTGKIYMMAENNTYLEYMRQWIAWIRQGKIGKVFYAEAEYIHNIQNLLIDEKSGEAFWRLTRPPIYYCSHSLGPVLLAMQDYIVSASCLDCGYSVMPNLGEGCLNMEVALFKTAKGSVIKMLRSQVAQREPGFHYYSFYGDKGTLENGREGWADQHDAHGKIFVHGEHHATENFVAEISDPKAPAEALKGGHGTCEYYMVRDFIDAVLSGKQPVQDAVWGAQITAPGIIAHESARQGGAWLDVPDFAYPSS